MCGIKLMNLAEISKEISKTHRFYYIALQITISFQGITYLKNVKP